MKIKMCIRLDPVDGRSYAACPHNEISGQICSLCKIPDQKYKLIVEDKKLPKLEIINATEKEHSFLKRLIMCNFTDSLEYRLSSAAKPFFQGGIDYNISNGWILIEFWGNEKDRIFEFIKYINDNINK